MAERPVRVAGRAQRKGASQGSETRARQFRPRRPERDIGFIVMRHDQPDVAIVVKLAQVAHRRADAIAVVPAALIGHEGGR
jgi:hypothetical protein